ncbi:MAG: ABC transporter substrate-binding protein [Haloferacaceae archaeon]
MFRDSTKQGRRRFLKTTGSAVLVGSTAGCVSNLRGGGTTDLSIAIPHYGFNWDTSSPFVVGQEKGFFEEEGVSLSKIEVGGGGKNVRAVVAGDADIALGTGLFAIMSAYRRGTGIRMIANQVSAATDFFWVSKEGSEYQSKSDVEGASGLSIGYSSPGSSTNMTALGAIDALNMDAEAVAVGGPPDSIAAVKTGEVDLSWVTAEFLFDPKKAQGVNNVFHGADIPPFDSMTVRGNLAQASWLENNGDDARSYLKARKRTLDWIYNNVEEAANILGDEMDVANAPKIIQDSLNAGAYAREHLRMDDITNLPTAMDLGVKYDYLDSKLSQDELDKMVDTSYLP